MKKDDTLTTDTLRPEYRRSDLGTGVRGRQSEAYEHGTNLVLLEPDVARAFPSADLVNEALRGLMSLAQRAGQAARIKSAPAAKRAKTTLGGREKP